MIDSALFSDLADAHAANAQHVIVCVDHSQHAAQVIPHAYAIATALAAPVTLFQVLEAKQMKADRPDPIEWDLRRHEARSRLRSLAAQPEPPEGSADQAGIEMAEGLIVDEIIRFAGNHEDNLLVLGTHGENAADRHCIGGTVHGVLERATDSVLLVPTHASATTAHYHSIIVPLDGSPWAESVLPLAVRVAVATHAKLVLAHVVPTPEMIEARPLEPEDIELRQRVIARNEQTARIYLERLARQLDEHGLRVAIALRHGDDVRTTLDRIISEEAGDLIILSARGQGGCEHASLHYGNVTSYLMTHAATPVLIVRPTDALPHKAFVSSPQYSRMPLSRSV